MVSKLIFGATEILIYSERGGKFWLLWWKNYCGECKTKEVMASLKSVGVKAAILRKISLKLCSIFWVFFHSNHHYRQALCWSNVLRGSLNHFEMRMTLAGTKIKKMRPNQVCKGFTAIPRNLIQSRVSYFLHYFVFDNHPLQVLQQIHSPLKQNHACIPGVSMVKCWNRYVYRPIQTIRSVCSN